MLARSGAAPPGTSLLGMGLGQLREGLESLTMTMSVIVVTKKGIGEKNCLVRKMRVKYGDGPVKPAAIAASVSATVKQNGDVPSTTLINPDLKPFLPFLSKGFVSLVGSQEKIPVVMLRDTAPFDSFILESTLPFSEQTDTGSFIPVRGMGMSVFAAPLHMLVLHSDLFNGVVKMGVRPALPVEGIQVIIGNDVTCNGVWPDQAVHALRRYCLALVGRMKTKGVFRRCSRRAQ